MKLLYSLAFSLALTVMADAQNRWPNLTPEERAAKIEAVRDAHRQRIRAERIAQRQKEKAAGRVEARASRVRDRAFMAVWTRLTPEVRGMPAARELAERVSRKPEWKDLARAQRVAAVTGFITNYQAIKTARQQATMDAALGAPTGAYPDPPDWGAIAGVMAEEPPRLPELEPAEVPDLFAINRQFNWEKPHGQWMTQLLKDIDAAKAAGDTETYESLTQRYSAWAEKSLRFDADSGR
ncbi:MAG: hypothetical protein O3A87_09350 [Verrucomicrobia bacterium]|nr:hypothetical protein [Verrucomicrobiota bacterium]